ncbi:hypothetical protein BST36_17070 [Mycolicibacterium moriokaense]|nr:hypothetical protein [Mycolicibacterium moriokaense]ORB21206.1 hypothetical protein BST36_17070 [Mycolicibacterium moriokaense]
MFADTFVDTVAIRALGSTNSSHADELAHIASTLSALPVAAEGSSLGPVGARFLSALAHAAADGSRTVLALSAQLSRSNATAYAVASAYESVDSGAGARIAGV